MRDLCVNILADLWFSGTIASAVCTPTILVSPLVANRLAFGFGRVLCVWRFLVTLALSRLSLRFISLFVQLMILPAFESKIHCTICVNGIWVLLAANRW